MLLVITGLVNLNGKIFTFFTTSFFFIYNFYLVPLFSYVAAKEKHAEITFSLRTRVVNLKKFLRKRRLVKKTVLLRT